VVITKTERVKNQTIEEWLKEYTTGIKVMPAALSKDFSHNPRVPSMKYDSHRTTKEGSLVMAFIDVETGQELDAFFNVDIKRQRGPYKGKNYRIGQGGQFLPKPRSKFRKFWLTTVVIEPRRWASVHKEMRSKLKKHTFTGNISTSFRKDGSPFMKVNELKIIETVGEQIGNKLETKKEQIL
jgi:hypothetical protein